MASHNSRFAASARPRLQSVKHFERLEASRFLSREARRARFARNAVSF